MPGADTRHETMPVQAQPVRAMADRQLLNAPRESVMTEQHGRLQCAARRMLAMRIHGKETVTAGRREHSSAQLAVEGHQREEDEGEEDGAMYIRRRLAEVCVAVLTVVFVLLTLIPSSIKQFTTWYWACHACVLALVVACMFMLLHGNFSTHLFLFCSTYAANWQLFFLGFLQWFVAVYFPSPGWAISHEIAKTTMALAIVGVVFVDTAKRLSRWFRLFMAAVFTFGSLLTWSRAALSDAPIPIFFISVTNTTITTNYVTATVIQTMLSVVVGVLIIIVCDTDMIYLATVTTQLTKQDVDTEDFGMDTGLWQAHSELQVQVAAAWTGTPSKSETCQLLSGVIYLFTLVVMTTGAHVDSDGIELPWYIGVCVVPLAIMLPATVLHVRGNVQTERLRYLIQSPAALQIAGYCLTYLCVGIIWPDPPVPVSQRLGVSYVGLITLMFLLQDALILQSRTVRISFTFATLIGYVLGTGMSLFVWQEDRTFVILRGITISKYTIWRSCWFGQFILAAGTLHTMIVDYRHGDLLCLVDGYVLRQSALKLKDPLRDRVQADW